MITLIFYSLIAGVFSLAGGLLMLWKADLAKKLTTSLLAFAAGAFIGVSLLDMLPEAVEMVKEPHGVFIAVLVGFTLFFILERLLMRFQILSHDHVHSEHTETLPVLVVLGDSIHNFLDGILIAIAFIVNPAAGLITAIGIAAHEIPQEIGDFSILLSQGWSKKKVILVNIFQSLVTIPGVIIGYYAGLMLEPYLPYLLGGAAGIFLYIAASDLIPEVHHRTGHDNFFRVVLPFITAIVVIALLTNVAHH